MTTGKIIHICGASGSGKSYIAHTIKNEAKSVKPFMVDGRKSPLGYHFVSHGQNVFLMGSYETVTGGCDNVPMQALLWDTIEEQWTLGNNVFVEGLFMRNFLRTSAFLRKMTEPLKYNIILLSTSLDECIKSIDERRAARGIDRKPLSTKPGGTVADAVRTHSNFVYKMKQIGAQTYRLDRNAAMAQVKMLLGGK